MDKDFNKEIEEHSEENYSMRLRDGSFPPRSTVHGLREENTSKKGPYAIIASSVIFLLIIGSFLFFQFPFGGTADNNDNNQAQPAQGDQIDNNGNNSQDNIVDSDNGNSPSEDLNQDNQDTENTPPQGNSTGSDFNHDIIHVVKKGESLYSISKDYYSDGSYYDDLARYNNLADPDNIKVGTEIRVPDVSLLSQK